MTKKAGGRGQGAVNLQLQYNSLAASGDGNNGVRIYMDKTQPAIGSEHTSSAQHHISSLATNQRNPQNKGFFI